MSLELLLHITCCVSAAIAAFSFMKLMRAKIQRKRLRKVNDARDGYMAHLLRNGFRPTNALAARLLRIQVVHDFATEATSTLRNIGFFCNRKTVVSVLCATTLFLGVLTTVLFGSVVGGVICALLPLPIFAFRINGIKRKTRAQMRESIPSVLNCFERCATSGLTLQQMFETAAAETENDLAHLFKQTAALLKTGGTAADALHYLYQNSPVEEMKFLSIALLVQHQTGGSLKQILHTTAATTRNKLALARQLQVQTAQARLSVKIVTLLPFILLGALSFLSPGFLNPFFESTAGFALLLFALAMQTTGIFVTSRILKGAQ